MKTKNAMFENVTCFVKSSKDISFNVKLDTKTCGNGFWSAEKREVKINKLGLAYVHYYESDFFGELRAYFTKRDWNVEKHGLIYTDDMWLKDFRSELKRVGFSESAIKTVNYSEQGMQGDNYVSLDVRDKFVREFVVIATLGNKMVL
jgi:hypothetical protein